MDRNRVAQFKRRQAKRRQAKRRAITVLSVLIMTIIIIGATSIYRAVQANAQTKRVEEVKALEEQQRIEREKEEARLESERLKAEEEERKRQKYGVGPNGKACAYDAKLVWEKMSNRDYSNNGEKVVFLTFDDGPSTTVTKEVLDVLKKNDVKATFFVIGKQIDSDRSKEFIKRMYEEGHAIGNHGYSHDYRYLYPNKVVNVQNFMEDMRKSEEKIQEVLGKDFHINVVRCPGGHMSWNGMNELDAELKEKNMASIDWNALNKDAEGKKGKTPAELLEEAKKTIAGKEMAVVLMHDTYGKENTAKMLDELIKYLKSEGYQFKTLV